MQLKAKILEFDNFCFHYIFNWTGNPVIDRSMKIITRIGDGYMWPIIGILFLFYDLHAGITIFRSGILAFAIQLPSFWIIKKIISRLRPHDALPGVFYLTNPPDRYSFPSGHTAGAFIVAVVIGKVFPILIFPFTLLASLIGMSRIYVGVHYPLDVIVGCIGGILSAIIALKIINWAS